MPGNITQAYVFVFTCLSVFIYFYYNDETYADFFNMNKDSC